MNKEDLLQNILNILNQVKDDKEKLQYIYNFFIENIYEDDRGEEKLKIPEKFKVLIHNIAESIDSGFVCYLNPDTMKYVKVPCEFYDGFYLEDDDDIWQEELKKVDNWDKKIKIEPLKSHESFKIMEGFVDKIPDDILKNKLLNALERRKPFANFKNLIDYSDFRQEWFKFKQLYIEEFIYDLLKEEDFFNESNMNE